MIKHISKWIVKNIIFGPIIDHEKVKKLINEMIIHTI